MKLTTHHQIIAEPELQITQHAGRSHWVVPVIMMVEGVHVGSGGPLLYTAEELGIFTDAWNGTAVVVGHPKNKNGDPVSANSPDLNSEIVGRLYNTRMEGVKLKSEAWIDIERLQELSPEAYEDIKTAKALDVSVGVFSEQVDTQGEFHNEEYRAVARNLRPDHLALLPGGQGACSWDDGCGVRTNENVKTNEVKNLKTLSGKELLKEGAIPHYISNDVGFTEIIQSLQRKLDQMDNEVRVHYLDELFEDNFVYRIHNRESGETSFFKRSYTVQEDGSIEYTSDPVAVRKDTSFVELSAGKMVRNKYKVNSKIMKTKCGCPEKVSALIAHESTNFTDSDQEWLTTLEDSQLDLMLPKEVAAPVANKKEEEVKKAAEVKTNSVKEDGPVKINSEELKKEVKAIFNESKDPSKFIEDFMPEALRGQMKSGLKMYEDNRTRLIEGIVDNSEFEATQLGSWADEDLEKLHKTVMPAGEFSANGATTALPTANQNSKAIASMIGVKPEEKK